MTVARISEISSVSPNSFQEAIVQGVERANKTLKNFGPGLGRGISQDFPNKHYYVYRWGDQD